MADTTQSGDGAKKTTRRTSLRVITSPQQPELPLLDGDQPSTIGRLIARTALLADTTVHRRRDEHPRRPRGRFGWFS